MMHPESFLRVTLVIGFLTVLAPVPRSAYGILTSWKGLLFLQLLFVCLITSSAAECGVSFPSQEREEANMIH